MYFYTVLTLSLLAPENYTGYSSSLVMIFMRSNTSYIMITFSFLGSVLLPYLTLSVHNKKF